MKQLWARIRALILLGVQALFIQPLRRLRRLGKSGESRFLEAYAPSGLLPLSELEEERRFRFSGCIHCGLCDVSCDARRNARGAEIGSLSGIVIGYSRSMTDYSYARLSVEQFEQCDDCDICEAACPVDVPIREIITDIREHMVRLAEVPGSRGGGGFRS